MRKAALFSVLLCISSLSFADCTHEYPFYCELPFKIKPVKQAQSVIHCGPLFGYLTQAQWDTLARYKQANIEMNIMIDGEFIDGPCIPSQR